MIQIVTFEKLEVVAHQLLRKIKNLYKNIGKTFFNTKL